MIKTRRDKLDALREAIGELHTYEVHEVLALAVVDGPEGYLEWLDRELG